MQLGDALGLSGLEVANLEAGLDRIGSGRLHRIARILDVPVAVFFETPDKLTEPQCREQTGSTARAAGAGARRGGAV